MRMVKTLARVVQQKITMQINARKSPHSLSQFLNLVHIPSGSTLQGLTWPGCIWARYLPPRGHSHRRRGSYHMPLLPRWPSCNWGIAVDSVTPGFLSWNKVQLLSSPQWWQSMVSLVADLLELVVWLGGASVPPILPWSGLSGGSS